MADLLSGGVMQNLLNSFSSRKLAETAFAVYRNAEFRGDEETMKRALGYMNNSIGDSMNSLNASKKALAENKEAARQQEKADQAERIEKAKLKAAEIKAEMQAAIKSKNNIDEIEISPENASSLQNKDLSKIKDEMFLQNTVNNGKSLNLSAKITSAATYSNIINQNTGNAVNVDVSSNTVNIEA